jgi:uncharacterized protein (TIGR01244 family)
MRHARLRPSFCALVVLALAALAAPMPAQAQAPREVPSAATIGSAVANYTPLRPSIATGGPVRPDAVAMLKSLGFVTILDLRGPDEGPEVEKAAAEKAGLRYAYIPVTDTPPTDDQIAAFGRMIEDAGAAPLLVHCASGNRVGAMWTIYRTRSGTPFATALAEGRRIGLGGSRETMVRQVLGDLAK